MGKWTRRELAKGVAASAAALAGGWRLPAVAMETGSSMDSSMGEALTPQVSGASPLRERLLMDRGWRFALGDACDPAKDFGFGVMAELGVFAKSGEAGGPTSVNTKSPFDDSAWEIVDLPHDWAVGLPFVLEREVVWHGGKPIGRAYPATSIGWYLLRVRRHLSQRDDLCERALSGDKLQRLCAGCV